MRSWNWTSLKRSEKETSEIGLVDCVKTFCIAVNMLLSIFTLKSKTKRWNRWTKAVNGFMCQHNWKQQLISPDYLSVSTLSWIQWRIFLLQWVFFSACALYIVDKCGYIPKLIFFGQFDCKNIFVVFLLQVILHCLVDVICLKPEFIC